MKQTVYALIILICSMQIHASEIVDLAGEVRIPLPADWQVTGDSGQFPFQIINQQQSAELLIYKSIISEEEKVLNNKELKESVDIIIKEIVLTLPEAKLLSNTGKIDDNRIIFSFEFTSTDTMTLGMIFHRLNGFLYGHPNGEQILFTLWGKTNSEGKDVLQHEILFMQNNFAYYGESLQRAYLPEESVDIKSLFLILFIIVATLFVFKKFKNSGTIQFSEDSHFWRCTCGRQNHNNHETCKRCGQQKIIKESV